MVDRIEGLAAKYDPKLLPKLKEHAKAAENAVAAKIEHAGQINRSEVRYTGRSVANAAAEMILAELKICNKGAEPKLSEVERSRINELSEALARAVAKGIL